jgi:hypothetical protein
MSVNRYGVIAQRHWARWLPRQYAAISDPERFFTTLGEEVARQIDDLTDDLTGEIRQGDSYLAHVGRLFAARAIAEELILPQAGPARSRTGSRRGSGRPGGREARMWAADGRGPQPPVMGGGERRAARARKQS